MNARHAAAGASKRSRALRGRWTAAAAAVGLGLAASACGDRTPTAVEIPAPEIEPSATYDSLAGVFHNQAVIHCDVTMSPLAITCGSPQAPHGVTPPIGGRGVHTRLITSGLTYDGGTQLFRVDVAVQNLLVNQIGAIPDGTVTGVTPFLHRPPQVTGGTGSVSVQNADGTTPFITANRSYFHYAERLKLNEATAARQWMFHVPTTVTAWNFRVYVSAHIMPVIVFDAITSGRRNIWRVAPDGSDLVQLTSATTDESEPTAARNVVVFTRYVNGMASLWSVPLSGGPMTKVLELPEHLGKPALNPHANQLAFTREQNGGTRVWTATYPGIGGLASLTSAFGGHTPSPSAIETSPVWHPLRPPNQVAFVSTKEGYAGIFRKNRRGQTLLSFVSNLSANVDPTISHDGAHVAFSSNSRGGFADIYIRQFGGNPELPGTALTARDLPDVQPSFLSDGNLVYLSYRPAPRFRYIDVESGVGHLIPGVSAGMEPRNPFGVPLFP